MKKKIIALILAIVMILSVLSMFEVTAFAAANPKDNKAKALISQYVDFLDSGKLENIVYLLCDEEKEEFVEFIYSDSNKEDRIGYFNYKSVEIVELKDYDGTIEYIGYEADNYTSVSNFVCYEVILNVENYRETKYLSCGYNKFYFVIGYDKENEAKLIGAARDKIWSEEASINGSSAVPFSYDAPVSAPTSGLWTKPKEINVKGYKDPIDFDEYCYKVTNNEFGTDSFDEEARKAVAAAVIGYGWHRTLVQKYGGEYDVDAGTYDQDYATSTKPISNKVKSAVKAVWNYTLLTSDNKLFPTFHEDSTSTAAGSGKLYHTGANTLGKNGKTWQQILHNYYDNGKFNKEMASGAIKIVADSHTPTGPATSLNVTKHKIACTLCGCNHQGTHNFVQNANKSQYVCTVCKYITNNVPGVMSVEEIV